MTSALTVPLADHYFEDYEVGMVTEYGGPPVSEESIIRFAGAFDPHAMHVDQWRQSAGRSAD